MPSRSRDQEEPALPPVPDRERKHPPEPVDAGGPVGLVEMKNRLGIALRPVAVAGSLHFAAQHGMVVDLTVEDIHTLSSSFVIG